MDHFPTRLDRYLKQFARERGIPGLAAAVLRNDEVRFLEAYGVGRAGDPRPLTPEHVFHFASVSKPFVATAIMQLVERRALALDDFVIEHLPYFQLADERYRRITIRHMLDHTSGMPDVEDYEWDQPEWDAGAAERYVRSLSSQPMLFAPGSRRRYSNMAFDALGDVIAKVSGRCFEDYVKSHILEPLGMRRSSFMYSEIPVELRTTGHVGDPARPTPVYPYNRRHAPSSTLNSNVVEMARWVLANLHRGALDGRRILDESSHALMWTPSTPVPDSPEVGLSWFLGEHRGTRAVRHGGQDTGFSSYLELAPEKGIGIVLASNWDKTDTGILVQELLDLCLSEP